MKKFRFLGIFAIVVFIVEMALSLEHNISVFKEGYEDGYKSYPIEQTDGNKDITYPTYKVDVLVAPIAGELKDSLTNKDNIKIPYSHTTITTYITPSLFTNNMTFVMLIVVIAYFYGIYLMIRLFISISNKEIFTQKNVWRIRFSCYSTVAVYIVDSVMRWSHERDIFNQIIIPGYEILGTTPSTLNWTSLAYIVLMAEIFAVSVNIKEEQDLTI